MQSKKSGGVPSKTTVLPMKKPLQMLHLNKKYRTKVTTKPSPILFQRPKVNSDDSKMDDLLDSLMKMSLPKTKQAKNTKKARSTKKPENVLSKLVRKQMKEKKSQKPKSDTKSKKMDVDSKVASRVSTRSKKAPSRLLY